jgi:putative intracellular protease/amidase
MEVTRKGWSERKNVIGTSGVTSVCNGSLLLDAAGLLKGYKAAGRSELADPDTLTAATKMLKEVMPIHELEGVRDRRFAKERA